MRLIVAFKTVWWIGDESSSLMVSMFCRFGDVDDRFDDDDCECDPPILMSKRPLTYPFIG